jgi:hypothetical protein
MYALVVKITVFCSAGGLEHVHTVLWLAGMPPFPPSYAQSDSEHVTAPPTLPTETAATRHTGHTARM